MKRRAKLSISHRENIAKSRTGQKHPSASITDVEAKEIFGLKGRHTSLEVSMDFAMRRDRYVSQSTIESIWSGRRWARVTGAMR